MLLQVPAGRPVKGWRFDLTFDPGLLRLNHTSPGSFLSDCDPEITSFNPGYTDNSAGTIIRLSGIAQRSAAVLNPGSIDCGGSGIVLILSFTALRNGSPVYTLSNLQLTDPDGKQYWSFLAVPRGALRIQEDHSDLATQVVAATQAEKTVAWIVASRVAAHATATAFASTPSSTPTITLTKTPSLTPTSTPTLLPMAATLAAFSANHSWIYHALPAEPPLALAVDPLHRGILYLATPHAVYKSSDGGVNWQESEAWVGRNKLDRVLPPPSGSFQVIRDDRRK